MPYSMALYPNEPCPVPEVGDIFVVEKVVEDVTDFHWGKCVHIKLCPATRSGCIWLDENGVVTNVVRYWRRAEEITQMIEEEFWTREYICPMCLVKRIMTELFPKCCGHYMVEFEDWEKDKAAWLRSREYNLELLRELL